MFLYTLCFVKKARHILLLNRLHKPMMGLWNGIGGKIEEGESAEQCVIRETFEETGIVLESAALAGTVTWITKKRTSGMYVFLAERSEQFEYSTPVAVSEGILDWKELDWILDPNNSGIADNIQQFLPSMLSGEIMDHRFTFNDNNEMIHYEKVPIHAAICN